MNNFERLKHVVDEYCPEKDILIETDDSFVVIDPNGLHVKTSKDDDNVQWTINWLTGQDPYARNRCE